MLRITIWVSILVITSLLPSSVLAQRGMAIDYLATSGKPADVMSMIFTRILAKGDYDGPKITLRSSLYVPSAVAMSRATVISGGLLSSTREEYEYFILYNPRTMALADRAGFRTVAQAAILAREIGHHLFCATETRSPSSAIRHSARAIDETADEYMGFILGRMNTSLSEMVDTQRFMLLLAGNPDPSAIAPRVDAVVRGWDRGGGKNPNELRARLEERLAADIQGVQAWW